jgi:hypothetical protein
MKRNNFGLPRSLLVTLVAGTAIVVYWRGIWGLFDLYLLPENPALSYAASAAIGLATLLLVHKLNSLD